MRFELIPEFRNEKPYPTATEEIGYEPKWMGITNGTDEQILATAKEQRPDCRDFKVDREQKLGPTWGDSVIVTYEQAYPRWFVEIETLKDLLEVIKALGGLVDVEGYVIREFVE